MSNVESQVKRIMGSVLGVAPESILENSSSDNVPGWDSLKHMNLILALEEEFQVTIPDDEVANLTSFKLIRLVLSELVSDNG